ncbi:glycoside hydrolase family 76 protein [Mucilaginibacter psychrotolerans]|uniref:Hydrolase n=1 Tax=Mucilaginibacter psychrotolerans TaxID=1524096 RepID=A0A4Y8SC81_9SPHI|nr:glycoside hydrolase family 76 protein [Mucilaginibacter psychrotolerans]TFF36578.1 hydrolase [Mucilaginibacter psychrotolerans]
MTYFRKMHLVGLLASVFAVSILHAQAQQNERAEYLKRAETMYANIWKDYRVPAYKGLFSENFPSNKKDTLNYFQGNGVKEKEVSFLWPFSGVFSATNVLLRSSSSKTRYKPYLDSLIVGIEQYRDTVRKPAGYQAYPVKFEKADRYYDDNGLVGIDYVEAYFNTKNPVYLQRAKGVFAFILSGWNDDMGGGVTWLEGHKDQKLACTNGMATLTALKIYQGSKDKYYLEQGKKFYSWMYQTLRDTATGIIANDVKLNGNQNLTFYTYNTGSLLEAAVLLYQFTGEKKYLAQAKLLALDSYKYYTGVPHDKNLNLHIDLPWFLTVLFRGYEALYKIDGNYQYIAAIEKDLNYAWQNTRDQHGLTTSSWTANPELIKKHKWLLDEACIAELYGRLSMLQKQKK